MVWPDLDPNCLPLIVFLKEYFEKVDFEKNQQITKKHAKTNQHAMRLVVKGLILDILFVMSRMNLVGTHDLV